MRGFISIIPRHPARLVSMKFVTQRIKYIITVSLISFGWGQVYDYSATPHGSDGYNIANFRIYVPESVDTVYGIYTSLTHLGGDSRAIVNDTDMRALCTESQFALMGAQVDNMHMETGVGNALLDAQSDFAQQSGHPEIEFSPLYFEGYSWGGQWSYHFTVWRPDLGIGFVTMKGGYHDTTDAGLAVNVPGYMFIGENDLDYRITNLTGIFLDHRPLDALWTLAMEQGAGHTQITDRTLLDTYFHHVISLRVPNEISIHEPVALLPVSETIGWLGDRSTYIIGSYECYNLGEDTASWSPSRETVFHWQGFVSENTVTDTIACSSDEIDLTLAYTEGWNLIGLPVVAENGNYLALFPEAVENTLYSFNGGSYVNTVELSPGVGYWLRFNNPGSEIVSGTVINAMTLILQEGWNLVSGITYPVEIETISDPEGLIISGTIYGFDGSYVPAEELEPGKGYWLRSSGDGAITLFTAQ